MSRTEEEMRRQLEAAFRTRNQPTQTRTLPDGTRIATRTAIEEPRRPVLAQGLNELAAARRNAPQEIAGAPRPRVERAVVPTPVDPRRPVAAQNLMDLAQARGDAPQAVAGPPQPPAPPAPDFGTQAERRAANPLPPEAPNMMPSPMPQGDLRAPPNALAPGVRSLAGLNMERGVRDPRPAGDLTSSGVGLREGIEPPQLPANAFEAGQAVRQGAETTMRTAAATVAPVVDAVRSTSEGLRNFAAGLMGQRSDANTPAAAAGGLAGQVMLRGEQGASEVTAGTPIRNGVQRFGDNGVSRWTVDGETVATGRTPTGGGGTFNVVSGPGSRDYTEEQWAQMSPAERSAANVAANRRAIAALDRRDAAALEMQGVRPGGGGSDGAEPFTIGQAPDMVDAVAQYASGDVGSQGYNMVRNLLRTPGGIPLLRNALAEAGDIRRTGMDNEADLDATRMQVETARAQTQAQQQPSIADQVSLQRLRLDQQRAAMDAQTQLNERRTQSAQAFRENLGTALQADTRLPEYARARIAGPAQRLGERYGVAPETIIDLFASSIDQPGTDSEIMEVFEGAMGGRERDQETASRAWQTIVGDVERRIREMMGGQ